MAGEKSFTANTPNAGEQRSPVELKAALDELLTYLNALYAGSADSANAGKVLTVDGAGGFSLSTVNTGVVTPVLPQGRLTFTASTPLMSGDVTGASTETIRYTAYGGNKITLYDGASWNEYTLSSDVTLATPGSTGAMYSIFLKDVADTLTLETVAWTDDTTPGPAEISWLDGLAVLATDNTKLYLGDIRTIGSGQSEHSTSRRLLVNAWNTEPYDLKAVLDTNSWTYTSNTVRPTNNDTSLGVTRVDFVVSQIERPVRLTSCGVTRNEVRTQAEIEDGHGFLGIDSTTAISSAAMVTSGINGNGSSSESSIVEFNAVRSHIESKLGEGYHYAQSLERGHANITLYGVQSANIAGGIRGGLYA